jgi:hypothetical protein
MAELSATARYGVEAAPDDLALVQELLNTASVGRFPDLLDRSSDWAEQKLSDEDRDQLRAFRDDLRSLTRGSHEGPLSWAGTAAIQLGDDGRVELSPSGAGAEYVISKVLAAVFAAQQLDTWRRLKTCRNERCQVAFYDRSRNNSGAWHNVKTCGNQANLRAHRERNREETS